MFFSRCSSGLAVLLLASVSMSGHAASQYTATVLDITSIDSNNHAINDSGFSVGFYRNPANNLFAAYTAQDANVNLLPTVGLGGPYNKFIDVNNGAVATGRSFTAGFQFHAFTYDTQSGVMTDIGTLGGTNSYGESINDHGQVVGISDIAGGGSHAFSYENGVMTDLGTLGGNQSEAYSVNNNGVIVGRSQNASGDPIGFVYQNGQMHALGTLGGSESSANAISQNDIIVGSATNANGDRHAVVFDENGNAIDLGELGGGDSQALSVNSDGVVVGGSLVANQEIHGFVWDEESGMQDINDLIVGGSGDYLYISSILDINENGDMVGSVINLDGRSQAVLIQVQAVPLPAAMWLFVSALAALFARKKIAG